MRKEDMLKGVELSLSVSLRRLQNSKLLLTSHFPYDAFILYSFSYEEFGKALIIKDYLEENKDNFFRTLTSVGEINILIIGDNDTILDQFILHIRNQCYDIFCDLYPE